MDKEKTLKYRIARKLLPYIKDYQYMINFKKIAIYLIFICAGIFIFMGGNMILKNIESQTGVTEQLSTLENPFSIVLLPFAVIMVLAIIAFIVFMRDDYL